MSSPSDSQSEPSIDAEQLVAQKKAWNQKQLLESILKRYFHLYGEIGGSRWPIWKADAKEDEDVHDSLQDANQYLKKLGWMVKLDFGDPWVLQILPLPERQFPSSKSLLTMWLLSIISLTLAGIYWMDGAIPDGGWFHESAFVDAVIGYVLPVVLIMIIASFVQKKWAERHGIRVGHLLPLPEPTIALFSLGFLSKSFLVWPFGLLLIPSLPRMDARPWNDRHSLGWVALSVPLIFILSGSALWLIGLFMTPEFVEVTSMQYVSDSPLLVNLISIATFDDLSVRLLWAHPFTKAGALLCFYGWISLLPIPTFPGGRILVARVGLDDARNSSNQFFLFMIILVFAWMFEAFEGFTIWLPILGVIIPLLLFMGSDKRVPIVLDEAKGIEPKSVSKMGMVLFIIFMISLPSQTPFAMDDNWDDSIEYQFDNEIEISENEGTWYGNLEIEVLNPSAITQHWSLDLARINGVVSNNWEVDWTCSDDDSISVEALGCGDDILPGKKTSVILNLTWNISNFEPIAEEFYLITYIDSVAQFDAIVAIPELPAYPLSGWEMISSNGEIKRCLAVSIDSNEPVNVSFPQSTSIEFQTRMYWIEGQQGLETTMSPDAESLCIRGQDAIILMRSTELNSIKLGDSLFMPSQPSFSNKAIIPSSGWNITDSSQSGWGIILGPGQVLSTSTDFCALDSKVSTPAKPLSVNESWIWDMEYRDIAQIPSIKENDSIILKVPDSEELSICSNPNYPLPEANISVERGPELILIREGIAHRIWTNVWAASMNGTLLHPEMADFEIYNPSNQSVPINIIQTTLGDGAQEWNIVEATSTIGQGVNNFEFSPSNSTFSTMRIDHQDGQLYIYLGSYM
jgi:hypothetical protein